MRCNEILFGAAVALMPFHAFAQTLATPTGHEVSVGVAGYNYEEPGDLAISIHGAKVEGEYTGTLPLDKRGHWFTRANVRGIVGNVTYDGWCAPFLIIPSSNSPNGYALDLGDYSPCSESGDADWYMEARGLVGRDFIGQKWALSPQTGVGFRHLSNGTTGIPGYRTNAYLYLPFGATVRTRVGADRTLGFDAEYDVLIHGWQTTRNSELGGGDVPPTATAPGFTLDGLSDVSFSQSGGWALRASAKYQATRHWSAEVYYVRWKVSDSSVSRLTATFTVNDVTAQQQVGAYEPLNVTNELGVKLGFHF